MKKTTHKTDLTQHETSKSCAKACGNCVCTRTKLFRFGKNTTNAGNPQTSILEDDVLCSATMTCCVTGSCRRPMRLLGCGSASVVQRQIYAGDLCAFARWCTPKSSTCPAASPVSTVTLAEHSRAYRSRPPHSCVGSSLSKSPDEAQHGLRSSLRVVRCLCSGSATDHTRRQRDPWKGLDSAARTPHS